MGADHWPLTSDCRSSGCCVAERSCWPPGHMPRMMHCLPTSWSGWQSCGVVAGCNTSDDDDERWHTPRRRRMPCLPSSWSGWQSCGVGAGCNTSDDDDERWHIPRMMARCNCSDERWLALDDELVRVTRLLRPMSLEAGPLMDLVRQACCMPERVPAQSRHLEAQLLAPPLQQHRPRPRRLPHAKWCGNASTPTICCQQITSGYR